MPALPPVPQVLKIKLHWTLGVDTEAVNILHWKYTGSAPDDATCSAIAADIFASSTTNLGALQADQTLATGVEVTDLTSATGGTGLHTGSNAGVRGPHLLPGGVALLQSLKIQRRYRGGKPRTYWPFGVAEDVGTGLAWAGAFITQADTQYGLWLADVNAIVESGTTLGSQVNVSYYQGFTSVLNPISGRTRDVPTLRVGGPVVDNISARAFDIHPASQRRRNLQGT